MKAAAAGGHYVIERLNPEHDVGSFQCGVEALDRYLRHLASQDARRGFAAVFVAWDGSSRTLLGYYTLSMAGVSLELIPEELRRRMPRYPSVPAVRLGRLAVATAARGRGLGTFLLVDSMHRALQSEVAWTAFLVDAKDNAAAEFYRSFGFRPFLDDPRHLYLVRRTVEDLVKS